MGVVAVVGSRFLPVGSAALVGRACAGLVRSGRSLAVGCASGADGAALSWALAAGAVSSVACFSAFAASGAGACGVSAVPLVRSFASRGGAVSWLAGGGLSVPLRSRLPARASAVVGSASAGLVAFLSSPSSRGSVRACRLAAARGLPVCVFPLGFSSALLPSLGRGRWVSSGRSGVWAASWLWVSA